MLSGQTLGGEAQLPILVRSHLLATGGNLSDSSSQTSNSNKLQRFGASQVVESYLGTTNPRTASSKLSDLKRKTFVARGRMERIAKSLAAVNATQVTHLSATEWKRIAETDVEDQY